MPNRQSRSLPPVVVGGNNYIYSQKKKTQEKESKCLRKKVQGVLGEGIIREGEI